MPNSPGISPSTRSLRVNWLAALRRGVGETPQLSPVFVAAAGLSVLVLDLRSAAQRGGPLGAIPGSLRLDPADVSKVGDWLGTDSQLVLVCDDGVLAASVAARLEAAGQRFVAAMDGGMQAWRRLGYGTTRDPETVARQAGPDTAAAVLGAPRTGHLSLDDVRAHLGDLGAIRWIRLAAFATHGKRSCVDGRDDHGVVGTPGGDAGELVLTLAAVERLTGANLPDQAVAGLMRAWIDTFAGFYMHTDDHALDNLIAAMKADPVVGPAVASIDTPNGWRDFLAAPPDAVKSALLELLTTPANVGCGHLKLILLNPSEYGVRANLTRAVVRSWFTMKWDGAFDLEYVVLAGGHAEGAVVQVTVEDDLWTMAPIPMVAPLQHDTQMFVNHPQVVDFLRSVIADFVVHEGPKSGVSVPDAAQLLAAMRDLAGQQLGETLQRLAAGLPIIEARFGADGVDLSVAGHVAAAPQA